MKTHVSNNRMILAVIIPFILALLLITAGGCPSATEPEEELPSPQPEQLNTDTQALPSLPVTESGEGEPSSQSEVADSDVEEPLSLPVNEPEEELPSPQPEQPATEEPFPLPSSEPGEAQADSESDLPDKEEAEEQTILPVSEPEKDKPTVELEQLKYYSERPCPLPACCSGGYSPGSELEQGLFDIADDSLYPDDVRNDIDTYQGQMVVWPGLILESTLTEHDDYYEVTYLLEYHYYDWIEDWGFQPETILLSPQDEGTFTVTWQFKCDTSLSKLEALSENGVLLMVYGKPVSVENNVVVLEVYFIRFIDKEWYTTEIFSYGRNGSNFSILKFPVPN